MAFSNYDDLVKGILDQSHRKDVLTRIPRFIALAESEFFSNPVEILEIRESEKTSTATAVGTEPNQSRFLALPPGFLSQRDFDININDNEIDLAYRSPSSLRVRDGVGTPCYFTITNEIEFDIVPDKDYQVTMKYFAEFTPLSSTNQTNEILLNEPNVYFFGAMKQLFIWSEDDDQAAKYDGLFTDAIKGANKKYKKGRYGKTPTMKFKGAVGNVGIPYRTF